MRLPLRYDCESVEEYSVEMDGITLKLCKHVYKPSEDTWLTLKVAEDTIEKRYKEIKLIVDIGTGTGVLGLHLLKTKAIFTIMIDINPCAVYCSFTNTKNNNQHHIAEIIQCDSATCLRPEALRSAIIVYNTPYLPVADYTLEGLAWSGGLNELDKVLKILTIKSKDNFTCLVATYSSLSGDDTKLLERLRNNYNVETKSRHYFFEDIKVVTVCRKKREEQE